MFLCKKKQKTKMKTKTKQNKKTFRCLQTFTETEFYVAVLQFLTVFCLIRQQV